MRLAIEHYPAAFDIAQSAVPDAVPQMEETLGVAYLHLSEMENGVYATPGGKDLFPIRPERAYKTPADSKKAIEYFLRYLKEKPDELEVTWLLKIAGMTLGRCPAEVPEKFLISPSLFESKEDVGRFVDVAFESGLNSFSTAGGVIAEDLENNGLLDVVTSAFDSCGPMHYFHNEGDGTFTDREKGRNGVLTANLEGNKFRADQLGDLVKTVLEHPGSGAVR